MKFYEQTKGSAGKLISASKKEVPVIVGEMHHRTTEELLTRNNKQTSSATNDISDLIAVNGENKGGTAMTHH